MLSVRIYGIRGKFLKFHSEVFMKFSAMFVVDDVSCEGLDNFEASDFRDALEISLAHASRIGGRLVRLESQDFGPFEFMR